MCAMCLQAEAAAVGRNPRGCRVWTTVSHGQTW